MCSSFGLELSPSSAWSLEIREIGRLLVGDFFWDSLLVDPIGCPRSLGRIGVRSIRFWFDLGFGGRFLGIVGSTDEEPS